MNFFSARLVEKRGEDMGNVEMSDELFQQQVILELRYIRSSVDELQVRADRTDENVKALRHEMQDFRSEMQDMRGELRELRSITAVGLKSLENCVEILRKRVDHIERYLEL